MTFKEFLQEKTIPWSPKPRSMPRWQQALIIIGLSLFITQSISYGLIVGLVITLAWYFWVNRKKDKG